MVNFKSIVFLFSVGLSHVVAQGDLLAAPVDFWTTQIMPSDGSEGGVAKGNGLKVSPDGRLLIATSVGGTVTSFTTANGTFEWEYQPPVSTSGIVRSHSQIVFTTRNATTAPYMVYSTVENENSADSVTRVIALDLDGNELWVSDALAGVSRGSPVVSNDGNFVFLTHNANFETIGHFTALMGQDGGLFYSQSNETTPFAPLGIYHSPVEGNYDGDRGRNNTNDFIMWTMAPKPTDTTIQPGHTFGFQFPVGFDGEIGGNSSEFGYFLLGEEPRDFQGLTAPVITNDGFTAYFSTSRSAFFGWVGSATSPKGRFNRGPAAVAGFDRSTTFAGQPVYASPVVSSSQEEPLVFCGTASTQFVRLSVNFTEETVVATTSLIKSEARVDPFDRAVYYVEDNGLLHQANIDSIADVWALDLASAVEGEMALSPVGAVLYVADTMGLIRAFQVSEFPITPSPTASPTGSFTESPTAPTVAPNTETALPTSGDSETVAPTTSDVDIAAPTETPAEGPAPAEPSASASFQPMMFLFSVAALAFSLLL